MKRKAISIWLTSVMIAAIFTVVLVGNVSAISNDHNLSGIVWQSDGSAPTGPTNFCIWVEHLAGSGNWNRFPTTGWVQTEQGVDGNWWYSYVLPNGELGSTWGDTDNYRVHVEGSPWNEFDGNTTSNGTLPGPDSPSGDPQPFPYNPSNPANSQNVINYSVGGGIFNEQQWDVRTVAPIDLAPTNITVQGMIPALWEPVGMPATPNTDMPIYFNVTNYGSVPSGDFYVSIWNCTATGTNIGGVPIDEFLVLSLPPGSDSGVFPPQNWLAPLLPGDYYVNITVDSQGQIPEFDEANNREILHFIVGPELVIVDLLVNGAPPTDPVYVGPGDSVMILAKAQNAGSTPTGTDPFSLTIYNTTGFGGPIVPGSDVSNQINALAASEESPVQVFIWQAPIALGDYYINISVDFANDVLETDETNNEISIHFNVPPIPVTTIWSRTPVHVETIYWYVTSTTDLNFTASSFNPPPYYTWYMITDDTTATVVKPWANYTLEGTDFNLGTWGEDTYRITYYSIDSVNAVEGWKNKTIIVDDSDPLTSIGFGGPRYRATVSDYMNITSQTPVTLTAQDNPLGFSIAGILNASGIGDEAGSGIFYRILRLSNSEVMRDWSQVTIFTEVDGLYTANPFMFSSGWDDDLYRIEYYSVDNLGHTESVKSTIANLDNTAPVKVVDYGAPSYRENPPDDIWNISSASDITLTADDGAGSGVDRIEYRVWNPFFDSGWITYSTPFSISNTWTDGIYTIEYNSTDNLGNDLTDSDTFYLDNTGPTSSISGDPWTLKFLNNYEVNELTIFTMTADDGDGSGVYGIEYRLDSYTTWYQYTTPTNFTDLFSFLPADQIPWNHTIYVRAIDNLDNVGPETSQLIYIEGDTTPPLPPVLRVYINGIDIRLEWEPSESEDIDYYLIYRSTTKMGFDFTTVYINTATDSDGGVLPLRTTWNDANAASSTASPDYYYTIRGVDNRDNIGYTSNIAGKTTLTFEKGYNTFALPLEPFEDITGSEILENEGFSDSADTIYRYDTNSQQWIGHAEDMPSEMDDFTLTFGEGYMIYIAEDSAKLLFTGSTGTTIRYIEGVGDGESFRNSLSALAQGNQVELNWGLESGATGYAIYRGINRLGENSLNDFSIQPIHTITGTQTTWTDTNTAGNENYYLVVAMDGTIEGASTYSMGVKRATLSEDYSLIALELEPKISTGAGKFASEMFSQDSGTLFYYDNAIGNWRGHPRVLPENINNVEVNTGFAYIVYVDAEDVSYVYTGV
jgi:hypothetical protein